MAEEVLINGLAWRQLTDTAGAGLSWNDVASVCPLGETPCQGSVNGVDFTGWTWASDDRVRTLLDTLTGLELPAEESRRSPVSLFFDKFYPVLRNSSVRLSFGIFAPPLHPDDSLVDAVMIQDAIISSGEDKMILQEIGTADTEILAPIFGSQPIGVFLVRDPDLELCSNGIDDDADGQVDIDDEDCVIQNSVVNDLEWRQVADTRTLDFWSVAHVCPAGGLPCSGSIGSVDLTGWIWASSQEVQELLLTLTGFQVALSTLQWPYDSNVISPVFGVFRPTISTDTVDFIFGFTYDSGGEGGVHRYPIPIEVQILDPLTCFNNVDDDADGKVDFDDADCIGGFDHIFVGDSSDPSAPDVLGHGTGGSTNQYFGYFLYREPIVSTPESCDNTFDDDGDGLIDLADIEDCGFADRVGLQVRCMHDPVYVPNSGDVVTIKAEALDRDGQPVAANQVEIWLGFDQSAPQRQVTNTTQATLEFPPGDDFSYSCRAKRGAETAFSGWRKVAVGPFDADFPAIPVLYNGPLDEKIDIVFFPDKDEYTSSNDPAFIEDVGLLIQGGYFTIPWFVQNQKYFNFWIGRDSGNSGPDPNDTDASDGISCLRQAPDRYKRTYNFADSAGIVHRSVCRDNAGSPGIFTIEVDLNRLQVVAHETGHRPFGLADEYCCDGGYFTRKLFGPPFPNMFKKESGCRNKGEDRGYDPNACRSLIDVDTGKDWWLFEPDYDVPNPEPSDLMQQQGCDSLDSRQACRQIEPSLTGIEDDPNGVYSCSFPLELYLGDPDGTPDNGDETYWMCRSEGDASNAQWISVGSFFDRYDKGDSENDRLFWFLNECRAGGC